MIPDSNAVFSIARPCRSASAYSTTCRNSQHYQDPWWDMTAASHSAAQPRLTFYTLALNFLPLAQLLLGVWLTATQAKSLGQLIGWTLAWIYLLPPLICRLTLFVYGFPQGRGLTQQDRAYRVWWFIFQWQILFNR